jgi:hypothetical protein
MTKRAVTFDFVPQFAARAMTSSHQELTKWNREILAEAMLREASFRMLENFVDVPCFAK